MRKLILGSLVLLAIGSRPALAQAARTLKPALYEQMKAGLKLDRIWMNPNYDSGQGFVVGKVTCLADNPFANVIDYFPHALSRLAVPESPNVISLTVVDLGFVDRAAAGYCSATMEVEGQVLDAAGQVMFAFRTREEVKNRETVLENFHAVMDQIVWKLSKDLGKAFQRTLQVKQELTTGPNPSGLVPQAPVATPAQTMDIKGRLLLLEDLRQKGLLTPEEYQKHKEEILKGL